MKKIIFFYRKPGVQTFSIEEIFFNLSSFISKEVKSSNKDVPYYSISFLMIIKNIWFAFKEQCEINHITGDVHYIILGLCRKNRNILTIHDCAFLYKTSKWSIKYWIFKFFWLDLPIHLADVVTTISSKTKQDIIRFTKYHPDKIKIIPNYVNPIFQFTPKPFNTDLPVILQVGTASNKSLARVIDAVRGIKCILRIIGYLSEQDKEVLANSNIKFENLFNLSYEQVAEQYRQCDLVIFATTFEGFGMPIIEAQKTGRPVVSSNIEPIIEVSGGAAHLVNPFDVNDIRKGIIKVIEDKHYRNELIQAGLKNCERFNIETIAAQYLALYTRENQTKL